LLAILAAMPVYLALVVIGPIDLPWQRAPASMQLDATVDDNSVRVVGTTDLPDGALVDYYFWRSDANNDGPAGSAEVRAGRFAFEHDTSGMRQGTWTIEASFSTVWGSAHRTM
jgi:hypothetical protein